MHAAGKLPAPHRLGQAERETPDRADIEIPEGVIETGTILIIGLLRRICGSLPSNLRGSDALVF